MYVLTGVLAMFISVVAVNGSSRGIDVNIEHCFSTVNESECVEMPESQAVCFGIKLPYQMTSLRFAADSTSISGIQEKLLLWSGLRNVPNCWAVVQPFLCSVYLPKCNRTVIDYPSREVCERAREPCKIVPSYFGEWPEFLRCSQPYFKSGCKNVVDNLEYNKTSTCEPPLIKTSNPASWYDDVEGCGIQCRNPLFTESEHRHVHAFIAVVASICLVCCLFTLLTFIIDWKSSNRYPAIILFYINLCFFLGSVGWLVQFVPGARKDIVCRKDGTMRTSEPQINNGENVSCTVVFFIVYFFMLSGIMWFVILAFSWHLTFKALGSPRDEIEGKTAYFHIVAWSLPLVMTIVCLAITEVDGDSLSGICFVGYINHGTRAGLVLVPVGFALACGMFFILKGLLSLFKLHINCPSFVSNAATAKIRSTIIRIGVFTLFALGFILVTFSVHIYIFINEPIWQQSFKDYVICEANSTVARTVHNVTATSCLISARPNLAAVMIHIFSYFGAGVAMSSWVWNQATLATWGRIVRKIFRMPDNKPVKLKKHKMIAKAFAKRHQISDGGRMSVSFVSTHDDPLGMKFDLNSASSREMSSNWIQAFPKLINRRGGVLQPGGMAGLRRFSDSDVQSIKSFQQALNFIQGDKPSTTPTNHNDKKKSKKKDHKNRIAPSDIDGNSSSCLLHHTTNGEMVMDPNVLTHALRRCSDTSVSSQISFDRYGCLDSSLNVSEDILYRKERRRSSITSSKLGTSDRAQKVKHNHEIIKVAEQPSASIRHIRPLKKLNSVSKHRQRPIISGGRPRHHVLPPINKSGRYPVNARMSQMTHRRTDFSVFMATSCLPGSTDCASTQRPPVTRIQSDQTTRPLVMNRPNPVLTVDIEPDDISTSDELCV